MCTLALYFKVFAEFPLVVAANRDEHYDRPSAAPALVAAAPAVLAGQDLRAGGTWLGINEHGVLAAVLNRRDGLEPRPQDEYRSRGLLCLDALKSRCVPEVVELLANTSARAYRPFTLVFADGQNACVAYNSDRSIEPLELETGLYIFSNSFEAGLASPKASRVHASFSKLCRKPGKEAAPSDLADQLAVLLADHSLADGSTDVRDAICVHGNGSGTVSASVVLFSSAERRFRTFYCPGKPCQGKFREYPELNVS